jgi:hypothetical protein
VGHGFRLAAGLPPGVFPFHSSRIPRLHILLDPRPQCTHRDPQVVIELQIHPKFAARRKITTQPKRGIGGNAARLVHDRTDASGRGAKGKREAINTDPAGAHEFFEQNLAGMNRERYKLPGYDLFPSAIIDKSPHRAFPSNHTKHSLYFKLTPIAC